MAKTFVNKHGEEYQKVTMNLSTRTMDYVRDVAKKGFRSMAAQIDLIVQERMARESGVIPYSTSAGSGAELTELIEGYPWQVKKSYSGDSWPSEYVPLPPDDQRGLVDVVLDRFRYGEGVATRFFQTTTTCLFIGDYKYWLMSNSETIDVDSKSGSSPFEEAPDFSGCSVHRARLYRDRRDFWVMEGDSPRDYLVQPWEQLPNKQYS